MPWPTGTRGVAQLCQRSGAEDDRRVFSFKRACHCATRFWTSSASDTKGRPGKLGRAQLLQTHRRAWKGTNGNRGPSHPGSPALTVNLWIICSPGRGSNYTTQSSSLKRSRARLAWTRSFSFYKEWGEGRGWEKPSTTSPKHMHLIRPNCPSGGQTERLLTQCRFCFVCKTCAV